jgi:hypothetical protein
MRGVRLGSETWRTATMTISGNYASPVSVNGYSCKNCTDVDLAKKHIDPAHPKDGPYGINAKDHATTRSPAIVLGGRLAALAGDNPSNAPVSEALAPGRSLDISV